eukprot:TRINITY_DN19240_c0_g1::TRINITY_DN19240_c0_g1_i1::g.15788::m.15788 TRINITY_DN19240_c0_g1::TRINITY_DN19240_c0_g1_i1::g.15788  ORF type:complete len:301 (-),score=6.76,LRAT/PF04970.8/1e-21,NLPC_P60/PF00877.14/0.067,Peptidase_C97/PF05903.9/0.48 TRINITY_DN19240_c0_g1_i1:340-1242(-)
MADWVDVPLPQGDLPELGDQIFYHGAGDWTLAEHHAIYIGDGQVIEFSGTGGVDMGVNNVALKLFGSLSALSATSPADSHVQSSSMMEVRLVEYAEFELRALRKNTEIFQSVFVRKYNRGVYPPTLVVARARCKLHTDFGGYDLLKNNCEHFATWCKTGRAVCPQFRVHGFVTFGMAGLYLGGPIGGLLAGFAGLALGSQVEHHGREYRAGRAVPPDVPMESSIPVHFRPISSSIDLTSDVNPLPSSRDLIDLTDEWNRDTSEIHIDVRQEIRAAVSTIYPTLDSRTVPMIPPDDDSLVL